MRNDNYFEVLAVKPEPLYDMLSAIFVVVFFVGTGQTVAAA